jgi:hypothetical protein
MIFRYANQKCEDVLIELNELNLGNEFYERN